MCVCVPLCVCVCLCVYMIFHCNESTFTIKYNFVTQKKRSGTVLNSSTIDTHCCSMNLYCHLMLILNNCSLSNAQISFESIIFFLLFLESYSNKNMYSHLANDNYNNKIACFLLLLSNIDSLQQRKNDNKFISLSSNVFFSHSCFPYDINI